MALEPQDLEVEPTQVVEDNCECCRAPRTVVTGFVHVAAGDTLAAYIASLYPAGPAHDEEVWIDVILGTWGTEDASDHVTLGAHCKVGQGCMLVEAAQAALEDEPIYGRRLTRMEGLTYPRVDEFWAVVDAILTADPTVADFYYGSPRDGSPTTQV